MFPKHISHMDIYRCVFPVTSQQHWLSYISSYSPERTEVTWHVLKPSLALAKLSLTNLQLQTKQVKRHSYPALNLESASQRTLSLLPPRI